MDLQKFLQHEGPDAIPDLPKELITDVKTMRCLAPYRDELIEGAKVRQNLAILRQRLIGQSVRRLDWFRRNGMRIMAAVDPHHFFQMRLQYGRGVWNNREFVEDTLKHEPQMAVPSQNDRGRVTVGYRPQSRFRQDLQDQQDFRGSPNSDHPVNPVLLPGGRSGARRDAETESKSSHESPAPGSSIIVLR